MNIKGSDVLANVNQIVIKQHLSMIEAVTDFDRINRYYVWNGKTGEQLLTAAEGDIGCCARNVFQACDFNFFIGKVFLWKVYT